MALPVSRARGGYHRTWPDGTPMLVGVFIRDQLAQGDMVAFDIYKAYKEANNVPSASALEGVRRRRQKAVRKEWKNRGQAVMETQAGKRVYKDEFKAEVDEAVRKWLVEHPGSSFQKRRCMNYNSFQHYIYILRQLGLIENTGQTYMAEGKSGSEPMEWHEAHPSELLHATDLGSPAWENPWEAYHGK